MAEESGNRSRAEDQNGQFVQFVQFVFWAEGVPRGAWGRGGVEYLKGDQEYYRACEACPNGKRVGIV